MSTTNAPFKRCSCGREYTRESWEALQYVGVQIDDVETFELKNCLCGSTIAVAIARPPPRPSDTAEERMVAAWLDACSVQYACQDGRRPWADACAAWAKVARLSIGEADRRTFNKLSMEAASRAVRMTFEYRVAL